MATKYYILLLVVGVATAVAAQAHADPRVHSAHIVSRVGGTDHVPNDRPKRALAADGVTLYQVVAVKEDGVTTFFSDASTFKLGNRKHSARPLAEAPVASAMWFRVEPAIESMSNTESGSFRFEAIAYEETLIKSMVGESSMRADVRPTVTPDHGNGLGTMRFKLVVVGTDGTVVSSPGADARRGRGSGGLSDAVHRVSLRADDTYLGFLTEMHGQPYIWASGGGRPAVHQSERLEGSDCADFVTYGWRRMGHRVPYTWSEGLRSYARRLGGGTPGDDGVYRDRRGNPVPFPRVGDLVLFPRHVGVLTADRGAPGVLDHQDVMFHTLFAAPRKQPIGDTSYASTPVDVLRWK